MHFEYVEIFFTRFTMHDFHDLTSALQVAGFTLHHPTTGELMAIRSEWDVHTDDDLIGELMPMSFHWLHKRIHNRVGTSLQWWKPDWETLYVGFRFSPILDYVHIGINEVIYGPYAERVIDACWQFFVEYHESKHLRGLIIDSAAATEDYDWYDFYAQSAVFDAEMPRIVVVPTEMRRQITADLSQVHHYTLGNFSVFSRLNTD